jgi:hypothetical protein
MRAAQPTSSRVMTSPLGEMRASGLACDRHLFDTNLPPQPNEARKSCAGTCQQPQAKSSTARAFSGEQGAETGQTQRHALPALDPEALPPHRAAHVSVHCEQQGVDEG